MNDQNNFADPYAYMEQIISDELSGTKKTATHDPRCRVTVRSFRRVIHDPDNISIKAALDGIVARRILPDDSTDEIKEVVLRSYKAKGTDEYTIIDIQED